MPLGAALNLSTLVLSCHCCKQAFLSKRSLLAGCQHALSQAVLFTAQCLAMHFASEASKYASMRSLHAASVLCMPDVIPNALRNPCRDGNVIAFAGTKSWHASGILNSNSF